MFYVTKTNSILEIKPCVAAIAGNSAHFCDNHTSNYPGWELNPGHAVQYKAERKPA